MEERASRHREEIMQLRANANVLHDEIKHLNQMLALHGRYLALIETVQNVPHDRDCACDQCVPF